MNAVHRWLLSGMICLLAVGCATSRYHVPGAERVSGDSYLFTATGTALVESPGGLAEITKAKLAAEALARASLLKKVKGTYLTERVTVEDLMFADQQARAETAGWLSRVEIAFEENPRAFDEEEVVHARASMLLSRHDLKNLLKYVE